MSLDLVAVQRDAVLLDALSQRTATDDADPIVGLLGALVADVDDGLMAATSRADAPVRPACRRPVEWSSPLRSRHGCRGRHGCGAVGERGGCRGLR